MWDFIYLISFYSTFHQQASRCCSAFSWEHLRFSLVIALYEVDDSNAVILLPYYRRGSFVLRCHRWYLDLDISFLMLYLKGRGKLVRRISWYRVQSPSAIWLWFVFNLSSWKLPSRYRYWSSIPVSVPQLVDASDIVYRFQPFIPKLTRATATCWACFSFWTDDRNGDVSTMPIFNIGSLCVDITVLSRIF